MSSPVLRYFKQHVLLGKISNALSKLSGVGLRRSVCCWIFFIVGWKEGGKVETEVERIMEVREDCGDEGDEGDRGDGTAC